MKKGDTKKNFKSISTFKSSDIVHLAAVTMIMSRRSGGEEGALAREVHVVAQENGWDVNF